MAAAKGMPTGPDNFDFQMVSTFDGYESDPDPTNTNPSLLIRGSQNVYKTQRGNIANRPGMKQYDPVSSVTEGTLRSYEWYTSLGATLPLRVANGNLQVFFNNVWTSLLTGITLTRYLFKEWYDATYLKDCLLMVHGDDTIARWDGGAGLLGATSSASGILSSIFQPFSTPYSDNGGIGYVVGDILTVDAGNDDAQVEVDAVVAGGVSTFSIATAGTNYHVGDQPVAVSPSGSTYDAEFTVTSINVSTGAITGLTMQRSGKGFSTGVINLSGGSGSSAQIDITAIGNTIIAWHIINNGTGGLTNGAINVPLTGGTGTGATINLNLVFTGSIKLSGTKTAAELGFVLKNPNLLINGNSYNFSAFSVDGFSFLGVGNPDGENAGSVILQQVGSVFGPSYGAVDEFLLESGGTGYALDDTITVLSPTGGASAIFQVISESGGVITGLSLQDAGSGFSAGTATFNFVGGNGNGATVSLISQGNPSFTNDIINVIENQVHLASYTSRLVYVSSSVDYTDYSVPTNRGRYPGDPDLLTLDGTVNAVVVRDGNAVISAGLDQWYVVVRTDSVITISSEAFTIEQTDVQKQETDSNAAAYAQEFVDIINDTIVYLAKDQQLRTFGTFRNLNEPAYPSLSKQVSRELSRETFTGGYLSIIADDERGDAFYLTAPATGRVWMYQIRQVVNQLGNVVAERLWNPPLLWNLYRVGNIDGVTVGYSAANPQTYQLWDTEQWHDDSPSGPVSYVSFMLMSYRSFGRRQGKWTFDKVYFEGYTTPGSNLFAYVYMEYQGALSTQAPIINTEANPAQFYSGIIPDTPGTYPIGTNSIGTSLSQDPQDLVPKFRRICGVVPKHVYEYALAVFSEDLDSQWEIICLGANATQATSAAVELSKKVL